MSKSREAKRKIRHRRVRKRVNCTASRPRLALIRSNRYIYAQVIDDVSGSTIASASSLEKYLRGERLNADTATNVGNLVAERARNAGIGKVVFDRGGYPFHGRVKELADAARETELEF